MTYKIDFFSGEQRLEWQQDSGGRSNVKKHYATASSKHLKNITIILGDKAK
jgi:hypothetical protein